METKSDNEVKVCKVSDIPEGQAQKFSIQDKEIGIFNVAGKYYAIDNMCIHAGAPLTDGTIDIKNCQVVCGWHAWSFDLATGKCLTHPRQDVFAGSYNVIVKGEDIYLQIENGKE